MQDVSVFYVINRCGRSETHNTNPSLQSRRAGHDRYLAFFGLLRVIIDMTRVESVDQVQVPTVPCFFFFVFYI